VEKLTNFLKRRDTGTRGKSAVSQPIHLLITIKNILGDYPWEAGNISAIAAKTKKEPPP
jgi:hypothetical protein